MLAQHDRLLTSLAKLAFCKTSLTTPDGKTHRFLWDENHDPVHITLNSWDVLSMLTKQDTYGLLRAYIDNAWCTNSLERLITHYVAHQDTWDNLSNRSLFTKYGFNILNLSQSHRDAELLSASMVDADFAAQWLDSGMSPSAGVYDGELHNSLHQAQRRKYSRIVQKIQSHCTQNILDTYPCWGAFVEFGLANHFNMSAYCHPHQVEFIHRRLKPYVYTSDYRLVSASNEEKARTYDAVVSIEQLYFLPKSEHSDLVATISQRLRLGGKALVQTLLCESHSEDTHSFFNFYFRHAALPQQQELLGLFAQHRLVVEEVCSFSDNYTQTLLAWLENFTQREQHLLELGIASSRIRMWRLGLHLMYAACQYRYVSIRQFVLRKV